MFFSLFCLFFAFVFVCGLCFEDINDDFFRRALLSDEFSNIIGRFNSHSQKLDSSVDYKDCMFFESDLRLVFDGGYSDSSNSDDGCYSYRLKLRGNRGGNVNGYDKDCNPDVSSNKLSVGWSLEVCDDPDYKLNDYISSVHLANENDYQWIDNSTFYYVFDDIEAAIADNNNVVSICFHDDNGKNGKLIRQSEYCVFHSIDNNSTQYRICSENGMYVTDICGSDSVARRHSQLPLTEIDYIPKPGQVIDLNDVADGVTSGIGSFTLREDLIVIRGWWIDECGFETAAVGSNDSSILRIVLHDHAYDEILGNNNNVNLTNQPITLPIYDKWIVPPVCHNLHGIIIDHFYDMNNSNFVLLIDTKLNGIAHFVSDADFDVSKLTLISQPESGVTGKTNDYNKASKLKSLLTNVFDYINDAITIDDAPKPADIDGSGRRGRRLLGYGRRGRRLLGSDPIKKLKKQISGLKKDVSKLKNEVKSYKNQISGLKSDIVSFKKTISNQAKTIGDYADEIAEKSTKITELNKKITNYVKDIESLTNDLNVYLEAFSSTDKFIKFLGTLGDNSFFSKLYQLAKLLDKVLGTVTLTVSESYSIGEEYNHYIDIKIPNTNYSLGNCNAFIEGKLLNAEVGMILKVSGFSSIDEISSYVTASARSSISVECAFGDTDESGAFDDNHDISVSLVDEQLYSQSYHASLGPIILIITPTLSINAEFNRPAIELSLNGYAYGEGSILFKAGWKKNGGFFYDNNINLDYDYNYDYSFPGSDCNLDLQSSLILNMNPSVSIGIFGIDGTAAVTANIVLPKLTSFVEFPPNNNGNYNGDSCSNNNKMALIGFGLDLTYELSIIFDISKISLFGNRILSAMSWTQDIISEGTSLINGPLYTTKTIPGISHGIGYLCCGDDEVDSDAYESMPIIPSQSGCYVYAPSGCVNLSIFWDGSVSEWKRDVLDDSSHNDQDTCEDTIQGEYRSQCQKDDIITIFIQ